jgi:hypothetical protein
MDRTVRIEKTSTLFLDLSSNCTGISLVEVDYNNKSAEVVCCGPLYFNEKYSLGKKLAFISNMIKNYFFILHNNFTEVVAEEYFHAVGPNVKVQGSMVVPKMLGVVQMCCGDEDPELSYQEVSASSWRGILGIKFDKIPVFDDNGNPILDKRGNPKYKRDYKTPVKKYIKERFDIPDEFISNVTGNKRQTSSDVYDSLGLACAVLSQRGIQKITFRKNWETHYIPKGMIE